MDYTLYTSNIGNKTSIICRMNFLCNWELASVYTSYNNVCRFNCPRTSPSKILHVSAHWRTTSVITLQQLFCLGNWSIIVCNISLLQFILFKPNLILYWEMLFAFYYYENPKPSSWKQLLERKSKNMTGITRLSPLFYQIHAKDTEDRPRPNTRNAKTNLSTADLCVYVLLCMCFPTVTGTQAKLTWSAVGLIDQKVHHQSRHFLFLSCTHLQNLIIGTFTSAYCSSLLPVLYEAAECYHTENSMC